MTSMTTLIAVLHQAVSLLATTIFISALAGPSIAQAGDCQALRFPVDNPITVAGKKYYWFHQPGSTSHDPTHGTKRDLDQTYAIDLNWHIINNLMDGEPSAACSPPASGSPDGWDECGKPVYAVADGTVVQAYPDRGWVLIEHAGALNWKGKAYATWYSNYQHMQAVPVEVAPGQAVVAGQQIGQVGQQETGKPHLHFGILVGQVDATDKPNVFLESVDPGSACGLRDARGLSYTYGDLETTYTWKNGSSGRGAVYNHTVDDFFSLDGQHQFQQGGPGWSGTAGGESASGFYDHVWWTFNSSTAAAEWGEWTHLEPIPLSASYRVYVFVPRVYKTTSTTKATYHIFASPEAATPLTTKVIKQSSWTDDWVYKTLDSAGRLVAQLTPFSQGDTPVIYLEDATGEADRSKRVKYDSIKIYYKQDVKLPR